MDNMEQLQVVVNEVQSARQQLANLRAQVLELETTLESVKTQPADLALQEHLERFAGREAELLATYDQLKQMLSGSENA